MSRGSAVVVLHVIDQLSDEGGAEASLSLALPCLEQQGVHNVVQPLSSRETTRRRSEITAAGVEILQPYDTPLVRSVLSLSRTCRQHRPDVVHSVLWRSDLVARLASVGPAKRLTSLVNMQYSAAAAQAAKAPAKLAAYRQLDGLLARHRTDHFHALAPATRDAAVAAYGIAPDRITVIPRGRPLQFYSVEPEVRESTRRSLGIRDDDEVIVTVGRQVEQKNQVDALRAFTTISCARPGALLIVVGPEGPASPLIKAVAAASPRPDRIRILGSRQDIPALLAAADVFVFTSLWEGFGGAVVEAMSAGLPVVAYGIPPLRDVCGDCAELVEPGDVDALVPALMGVLDDKLRAADMGRAGVRRAAQHYDLGAVTREMANLYRSIADGFRAVAGPVPGGRQP